MSILGGRQCASAIPIDDNTVAVLKRHRAEQNQYRLVLGSEYAPFDLVFCSPFGNPIHNSNLTKRDYRPAVKRVSAFLIARRLSMTVEELLKANSDLLAQPLEPNQEVRDANGAISRIVPEDILPHIPFENLRHTHASLLLAAGENPKTVAERLGHAQITLTMDTYSAVLPTIQRSATESFAKALQEAGSR